MTDKSDPSKPRSNDEKFKPQNVANERHGNLSSGRKDHDMERDISRGSKPGIGNERG